MLRSNFPTYTDDGKINISFTYVYDYLIYTLRNHKEIVNEVNEVNERF